MRKGLVSFIIILSTLIPFTAGCQSSPAETVSTTIPVDQSTRPELSITDTKDGSTGTEPGNTVPDDLTGMIQTTPDILETEPDVTETPTESIRETTPPVTEEPEYPESTPTQSEPTVPPTVPAEPDTTEPPDTEPSATEPAEVIDLNTLVQYGLSYAASTHGYQISPGVRDGYYPAYTCTFKTMDEGKAAIRGCVDDTTKALLAVPGTQIAVKINGVMCRARIDIVIVRQSNDIYLVNVYYG